MEKMVEEKNDEIDFEKLDDQIIISKKSETRKVQVPKHRLTPLKREWEKIVDLIVNKLKLKIRMNVKRSVVELKTSEFTEDDLNIQRAQDFFKAFMYGFGLNDAMALLRLSDLYIESFEIKDVKMLKGAHLSRCIGRITGEKGKTKNAIENSTKTRIVIADSRIYILGSYGNIKLARDAVCSLILGSPAGKVYLKLKKLANHL